MPIELIPPLTAVFLVGLTAAAFELKAAFAAPVCPQCGHCRLAQLEKQRREDEAKRLAARRMFGIDDRDDDPPRP